MANINNNNSSYARAQNAIGPALDAASFGWLGPVLTRLSNERRWVLPQIEDNQVIIAQGYPLQMVQNTPESLLDAVRINALGSSVKSIATGFMPSGGGNLTLDLGTDRSFGVRIKITDSPLNFSFGYYKVDVQDGSTVLGSFYVTAAKVPVDLVVLGIANNGGQATPLTIANPKVTVYGATAGFATSTTTFIGVESLNQRDLGDVGSR